MWKDFLYFSKAQQVGIIVFIILILLLIAISIFLPKLLPQEKAENPILIAETKAFANEISRQDSIVLVEKERKLAAKKRGELEYKQKKEAREKKQNAPPQLFRFNPNTADSLAFIRLGIDTNTTANILKYRNHGGEFKKEDDFLKIYGITEEQFKRLKPYITIAPEEKKNLAEIKKTEPKLELASIELNSADTTELMRIKGIGSYSATAIVLFRKKAGGFYTTDQLSEIKGIRSENIAEITPYLYVNRDLIRKIKINSTSIEYLKQHPYINFYQAKAIVEYRKAKGEIKNIEELKKLPDFSADDFERLQHYFSFN